MKNRTLTATVIAIAIAAAALIATAGYLVRASCKTDRHALNGDVRRDDHGTMQYFDGRCWAAKPSAPGDMAY